MEILILTRGRPNRQTTFDHLPPEIQKKVIVVSQHGEPKINRECRHVNSPRSVTGIADKCQWVVENFGPRICMLDDDLVFATRRRDDPTKFVESGRGEILTMFADINAQLDNYVHVGVSGREGANYNTDEYDECVRMTRIMAYRADVLVDQDIRFDRVPVMQDFDVTLQLLRKGYPNRVLNWIVHNQNGSNTDGGCSLIRTDEVQAAAANRLAELHPGFVTVVKKQTKKAWGGKERTDVRIGWKSAYKSARNVRLLDQREGEHSQEERSGATETVE